MNMANEEKTAAYNMREIVPTTKNSTLYDNNNCRQYLLLEKYPDFRSALRT